MYRHMHFSMAPVVMWAYVQILSQLEVEEKAIKIIGLVFFVLKDHTRTAHSDGLLFHSDNIS